MQIEIEATFEATAKIIVAYTHTPGRPATWDHPAEDGEIEIDNAALPEIELRIGSQKFCVPLDSLQFVKAFRRAVVNYVAENHGEVIETDVMLGG